MATDIDNLPTPQDDDRVQQLKESLDDLASDLDDLKERLPEAKERARELRAEADEMEVEVYASEDVSESDVQDAKAKAADAEAEVEDLEEQIEKKEQALDRVKERFRTEINEKAGKRLYEEYAEAYVETSERLRTAAEAFLSALEDADKVRRKAQDFSVVTTGETPPLNYPSDRISLNMGSNENPVRKAVQTLLDRQAERFDAVKEHVEG
jgi:chromosome segregation ATPase